MKELEQFDAILKKVTVIIPTYNRPEYLRRLINYYNAKKTTINFLILDSSNAINKAINQKNCLSLSNQFTYLAFPNDIDVAKKLFLGLQHVKTEFCAFCADDDLVFVEGLAQAAIFLKEHQDYVCVDGIYLNFNLIKHDIHLMIEYATHGFQTAELGARIFKLYQKYESLFYGVFRIENALKVFSGVSKQETLHYQELFQATATLLLGKTHRLPIFYAARQHCQPADINRDKWQTYYWFADNPNEFITSYLVYKQNIWDFYQQHVSEKTYTQDTFSKIMDVTHAMYFGIGCPPEYFHSTLQSQWPNESFQKSNLMTNNVCNQLKPKRRIWLETCVENIINYLPKILLSYDAFFAIKKLNRQVAKSTTQPWNCILASGLGWLASVTDFKKTYHELCIYLEENA